MGSRIVCNENSLIMSRLAKVNVVDISKFILVIAVRKRTDEELSKTVSR